MQKIYKILNPATGEYEPAHSPEECTTKLANRAWDFYVNYSHGQPYSIVEVDDDGTETWRNTQGEEILSPEQIQAEIQKHITVPQ